MKEDITNHGRISPEGLPAFTMETTLDRINEYVLKFLCSVISAYICILVLFSMDVLNAFMMFQMDLRFLSKKIYAAAFSQQNSLSIPQRQQCVKLSMKYKLTLVILKIHTLHPSKPQTYLCGDNAFF